MQATSTGSLGDSAMRRTGSDLTAAKRGRPWGWFKRIVVFTLAVCMTYGGSVNLGLFDIFPALPFTALMVWMAIRFKGVYAVLTPMVLMACVALWVMKRDASSTVFFPAVGREFWLGSDACVVEQRDKKGKPRLALRLADAAPQPVCLEKDIKPQAEGPVLPHHALPRGHRGVIKRVQVQHELLGEHYALVTDTPLGELTIRPESKNLRPVLIWSDEYRVVDEFALRRQIFAVPSALMYWPTLPVTLPLGLSAGYQYAERQIRAAWGRRQMQQCMDDLKALSRSTQEGGRASPIVPPDKVPSRCGDLDQSRGVAQ